LEQGFADRADGHAVFPCIHVAAQRNCSQTNAKASVLHPEVRYGKVTRNVVMPSNVSRACLSD
jgi:hypothetical protein